MILFIGLFLFLSILYVFVNTNHWTIGKKILVGLVSSLCWMKGTFIYYWFIKTLTLSALQMTIAFLPLTIVGFITAIVVWRTSDF